MRFLFWALVFQGCCSIVTADELPENFEQLEALREKLIRQLDQIDEKQRGGDQTPPEPFPQAETLPLARYRFASEQAAAKAEAPTERFPRALMVCGEFCPPCEQMKRENPDIIGPDPTFPVQAIVSSRVDYTQFGLPPSSIFSFPTVVILEGPGKVHRLENGALCKRTGRQSPAALRAYITAEGHDVDLSPWEEMTPEETEPEPIEEDTVWIADRADFVAAVAAHLSRQSDRQDLVGSIFDVEVDVPNSLITAIDQFISSGQITLGPLKIYMPQATTISNEMTTGGMLVTFSKPLTLTYSGPITVESELHSIDISDHARRYLLELKKKPGNRIPIPDLTVVLE